MIFFGLGGLIYVFVLLTNAVAILSEDRFLARIGWGSSSASDQFGGAADATSFKAKAINLISSIRTLMRIPLIFINTFVILYEIVLG